MITFKKLLLQQVKYVIILILFWKLHFEKKNILNYRNLQRIYTESLHSL